MSRVAWELVVVGRAEKYIRFVSDKNLWSARGGKFITQECAVGDGNVYIEGCWAWRVPWLQTQLRGDLIQRAEVRGPAGVSKSGPFWLRPGETEANQEVTRMSLGSPGTRTHMPPPREPRQRHTQA